MNRAFIFSARGLIVILMFWLCCSVAFAQFGGGSGTEADPYLISTPTHLNNVRNYLNACFRQTANIDLNIAPYNQGNGWTPIGSFYNPNNPFTGNYDGDGYAISNLFMDTYESNSSQFGLFGYAVGADFTDVCLQSVNVSASDTVGGLLGYGDSVHIQGCSVSGEVVARLGHIGGLVGNCVNNSTISNCSSSVNVTGGWAGSLIGNCEASSVTNSSATGDVNVIMATDNGGGLLGYCSNSVVTLCHATGNVNSVGWSSGGLIGRAEGNSTITACYALGNVDGTYVSGGFIGTIMYGIDISIVDCYARGDVTAYNTGGGFIGSTQFNIITHCYSTGLVTANIRGGGFIASAFSVQISNCYWDTQTSGQTTSQGGEGRTTDEMTYPYAANTFVGWDWQNIWIPDSDLLNNGYPYFLPNIVPNSDDENSTTSLLSMGNYPNPFNPHTTISFNLPKAMKATVSIYNLKGQKVRTLADEVFYAKGSHSIIWDGSSEDGKSAPSGVYLYKLVGDGISVVRKMTLLK